MFLTIDTLEKVLPVAVEYIPLFIRRKKLEVARILDKFKQAKEIEKVKQYSRLLDYLRDNPQELAVVLQEFPAEVREHILGKKPKMMKKGGAMPPESLFFRSAKQSYKAVPERELAGFELVVNTPTCKVYKKDNVILIGLRGTDIADKQDLIADASLAINRLSKTERYKKDKATLERLIKIYPPQDNEYYLSGHSLSGAIINQLKYDFPFLRNAVEYNPAFQVKDLIWSQKPDIKRIYTDKDGLYRLGGRLFAKNTVIPAQNSTGVDAIDAVSGHILSNFASLYPEGGNRIFSRSTHFNAPAPAPAPARPSNPMLPHKKPHAKVIDLYDDIEIFKRLSIFTRLVQTMNILAREGYIELRNAEGRKLDPKTYFAFVPAFSVNPSKFTVDEFFTLLRESLKEIAFSPEEFDRIKDVPISSNYFTNIYQVLFPQRERVPEPVVERNEVIQPNLLNPEVNPPASIWRQEAIDAEERAKKQGRITRFGRGGSSESDEEAEELRLARTGSGIHRKRFFKRNNLQEKHYSLRELSKISAVPLPILQEVYNRGIGAYKTNPTSVRLKGSYVKGVDAPRSKKLSKEQWAFARVYSFLDGNQKHDNDLRGGNEEEDQRRADEQIEAEARDLHHLVEQYYRDENPPVITPRQEEPFSSPFQERRTEKQLSPVQGVDIPTIEEPMRQPKFEDSPKRKRKATAKKPKAKKPKAKGGSKMSGFVKMLYAKRVLRKKPTDYTPAVRDKKAPAAFLKHKIKKRSKHLEGLIGGIPTLNRPFTKGERETLSPKELEELRRLERERKRKSVQNKREKAWNALTDKQRENLLLESNNNLIKAQNKALKLM